MTVWNGYFCNAATTTAVTYERPGGTDQQTVTLVPQQSSSSQFNLRVTAPSRGVDHYRLETGNGAVDLQPGQSWTGVPGSGARNSSTSLTLRACGGPGSSFCTLDGQSQTFTGAALDTSGSISTAQQGKPLVVAGPGGSGITVVQYTATWYDENGNRLAISRPQDTWTGSTGPTPPDSLVFTAKSVSVAVEVSTPGVAGTVIGDLAGTQPVADAPAADSTTQPGA